MADQRQQQQQQQQQWPYYDSQLRLWYTYDQRTDELVYENGHRRPRDPTAPRSQPGAPHQQYSQQYPSPTQGAAYTHENISSAFERLTVAPIVGPFAPTHYQYNGINMVSTKDSNARVHTLFGVTPKEMITDPQLLAGGVKAHRMLYGTEGESEPLFPGFKLQKPGFFVIGRVFHILWAEPAGETRTLVTNVQSTGDTGITTGRHTEKIYSKVRRFVVVRAGAQYCSALPVVSYGRRGVGKPGVAKHEHAIIHTTVQPPAPHADEEPQRGEYPMRDKPIRVVPDSPTDKLDPMSRIDFGRVHTVQHNIKTKSFGMVHQSSRDDLVAQFGNVWLNTIASPSSSTSTSAPQAESAAQAASASGKSSGSHPTRSVVSGGSQNRRTTFANPPARSAQTQDDDEDDEADDDEDADEDGDEDDDAREPENPQPAQQASDAINMLRQQGYTMEQAFGVVMAKLQNDRGLSREHAYRLLQGWTGYRSQGSSAASTMASSATSAAASTSTSRTTVPANQLQRPSRPSGDSRQRQPSYNNRAQPSGDSRQQRQAGYDRARSQ